MSLKPKAARRLLLVALSGVLVVAMLIGLVVVRSWQNERRTRRLRDDGMAAYQKADYPSALDHLSGFLKRQPKDRQAWLAFADAHERVEEPDGRNLAQAALAYDRAFSLDSADAATGLKLLRLYNLIGRSVEARDLALRLRPDDLASAGPAHLDVLMEEASSRSALKLFDAKLNEITERMVTLDPAGYRVAVVRTGFLINAGRKDDAVAFVSARLEAHPGDARFDFLSHATLIQTGRVTDPTQYIEALNRAAGLDPTSARRVADARYTDTMFSGQLLSAFDQLGMSAHALRILQDAATRLHDADARRILARREWQSSFTADFMADFPDADTSPNGDHSEILAFRALVLHDLGRAADAATVVAALRARARDYLAHAWSSVLGAWDDKADPKNTLALVDAAIKEHHAEPVFAFFRGNILERLGRAEEARQAWEGVYSSAFAEGWALPGARVAETLLDEGRIDEGAKAARTLLQRARSSPLANLVLLRAEAMLIESGRPVPNASEALARIDATSDRLKNESQDMQVRVRRLLLPARAVLLSSLGRRDEARALVERAIADPELLNNELTRRLALVSARLGLGMESGLLAAPAANVSDPGSLLGRALLLESSGQRGAATALVDTAFSQATDATRADAALARAQFYDAIDHPDALKVWRSLVEQNPRSLPVHVAAIRARAPGADPAFVDSLAARITELGGSDPDHPTTDIRFARARALLFKSPSAKQRDDAVTLLRQVVIDSPGRIDVRNVLIDALLLDDSAAGGGSGGSGGVRPNEQAAIEQLNAAAALVPNRAPYSLRLASILQHQGRISEAVSQLSNLALDRTAGAEGRLEAVDRLTGLREIEQALRGVEALAADQPAAGPNILLRRGSLLVLLRRDREAADTYRLILQQPALVGGDVDTIVTVAVALRNLHDAPGAAAALAKLDNQSIKPVDRALAKALFAAGGGDATAALAEFAAATTAAPDDPRTWLALARFHLGRAEPALAEAAARSGLKLCPTNTDLPIVLQQAVFADKNADTADLTPLIQAFAGNPATARRAEALRAIAGARKPGAPEDPATLVKLAADFADDPATQLFAVRRLMAMTPPRIDDAAGIIRRAAVRYPGDPAVQEQAARILAQAERLEPALEAANAWRTLSRKPEADLAVAEAHLALGHARPALDAVRGLTLPATLSDADQTLLGVLNIRVRAGVMLRDTAAAFQLLQPYLAQSSVVRTQIALPTAFALVPDAAEARAWIEAAAAKMDPRSIDDQTAIAAALGAASDRFTEARSDLLRRAIAITDPFAALSDAPAKFLEVRASLLDSAGDKPGAIVACRAALAKNPRSVPVLNRLVVLLLASRAEASEIVGLARRAVEAGPGAPGSLILLANALLGQAERPGAPADSPRREAAEALRTLTAMPVSGADMLIQIAALAERLGDAPTAIGHYERAIAAPDAPRDRELAIIKNNLAFALCSNGGKPPSADALRRAKTLAEEAVRFAQLPPFYETLGAVNAAMADRSGAADAYRKALAIDPRAIDARIGLADLLATGAPPERAEAAAIIRDLEADAASIKTLSESRKRQLQEAKRKLAGG
jgi:tetratricopeptide (TPR) repeat protein